MDHAPATDTIGSRIISAARLAVAVHLAMNEQTRQSSHLRETQRAMIGGTDRLVTDDLAAAGRE